MHRFSIAALCAFATAAVVIVAHAPASAGTVAGTLTLPAPTKRASPMELSRGFVARVPHPLLTGKPVENPLPAMFVVLTGGTPTEANQQPSRLPVELTLLGHRFDRAVFPVLLKQVVLLKNASTKGSNKGISARLDAPTNRTVFSKAGDAGTPLNPNGERELVLNDALVPIELLDLDNRHIRVNLVGVTHRLFAVPSPNGSFQIDNVPAGKWTARVWYQDGFLKDADTNVVVPARGVQRIRIKIPPAMTVEKAAQN